jgi:hypothetical protein
MRKRRGIDLKTMRRRRERPTRPDERTTIVVITLHHFFKGDALPFNDFAHQRATVQDENLSSLEPADGGAANLFPSPASHQTFYYCIEVARLSEGIAELVLWMMTKGGLTVARRDDLDLDNLDVDHIPLTPPPRSVGILSDAEALHVPSAWPIPVVLDSVRAVHSFIA